MSADAAFSDTQSPDVFRALSGMGDPHITQGTSQADEDGQAWFAPASEALARRLTGASVTSTGLDDVSFNYVTCRSGQPFATLKQRIAQLGPSHPYIDQWIRVERTVLALCSTSGRDAAKSIALPPPMLTHDARVAGLQRADRAYQAASATFYAGRSVAAAKAYDAIARSASPLRHYARYMAVAIRAGSPPAGDDYKPLVPVARSIADAQALFADPAASDVHRYAYDLIGWIGDTDQSLDARRAQARQALAALKAPISQLDADADARRRYADVRDGRAYLFSPTKDAAAIWDGAIPLELTGTRAMAEAARTDRLAEWMIFPVSPYQPRDKDTADPAVAWALVEPPPGAARVRTELDRLAPNKGDASNPWVHERLMWSETYEPALWPMVETEQARALAAPDERWVEAAELDLYHETRTAIMFGGDAGFDQAIAHLTAPANPRQPAWSATVCESLRFLIAKGRLSQARRLRDQLGLVTLARTDDASTTDRNSLDGYSFRDDGLLDVLLLLAEDEDHLVPLLSPKSYDQAPLLNRLSIAELRRLAEREDVPSEDRSAFARTAWARTYALGRTVDPRLDRLMRKLNPEITAQWLSRPGRPITPGDRRALQDVLATPALNILIDTYGRRRKTPDTQDQGHDIVGIDHNKRNDDDWWCPWRPKTTAILLDQALAKTLIGAHGDLSEDEIAPDAPPQPLSDWDKARAALLRSLQTQSFLLRSEDRAEIASLTQIRSAPELLSVRSIDWVDHPGLFGSRQGQADTLAAAVISTRWGCDWAGRHGVYSRAAFDLLHKNFALSAAAGRTKYWYDCNGACGLDSQWPIAYSASRRQDLPPSPSIPLPPRGELALERRIWARPPPSSAPAPNSDLKPAASPASSP